MTPIPVSNRVLVPLIYLMRRASIVQFLPAFCLLSSHRMVHYALFTSLKCFSSLTFQTRPHYSHKPSSNGWDPHGKIYQANSPTCRYQLSLDMIKYLTRATQARSCKEAKAPGTQGHWSSRICNQKAGNSECLFLLNSLLNFFFCIVGMVPPTLSWLSYLNDPNQDNPLRS